MTDQSNQLTVKPRSKVRYGSRSTGLKTSLSFKDKLVVMEALKESLDILSPDTHRYHTGRNDYVVASEMPFMCSGFNVAAVRREIFGKMIGLSKPRAKTVRVGGKTNAALTKHSEEIAAVVEQQAIITSALRRLILVAGANPEDFGL